jgi:hypothetical protein
MIDIAKLQKGDIVQIEMLGGFVARREVVRVVDTTGARGGIVDTKPVGGRYSRTSGYVLGDTIVAVESVEAAAK